MRSHTLILSLHRIGYPPSDATHRCLFTSPRLLAFQIRILKLLGYRFTTLRDAFEAQDGKVAVITLDDGYVDNWTEGLPVFIKHDVPATVFVITRDVGARNVVWDEAGEKLPADFMTWETLKMLSLRGWEIGSHAHSHIHLARHPVERQEFEILRSIKEIENNLGISPVSFAYPYGSFNSRTKEILNRVGLKYAVTANSATSKQMTGDTLLELDRVAIGGRLFHHYFKSVYRTLKAIGLRGLIPALDKKVRFPSSVSTSLAALEKAAES